MNVLSNMIPNLNIKKKKSQIHLLVMEGVDVQLFVNILQIKLRLVHIHG